MISIVALDFGSLLYNEATKAMGSDWAGGSLIKTGLGTGVLDFLRSPLQCPSASRMGRDSDRPRWHVERLRSTFHLTPNCNLLRVVEPSLGAEPCSIIAKSP